LRRASALPPPLGVRIGWATSLRPTPPHRFHWTDSTDVLFIMSGKHGQILDRGEVLMRPGDVLIQNGTMHSHQTVEPTAIGYVTLGALRAGPHPTLERLQPISGPVGGHRAGEGREKKMMDPWDVPGPGPRSYPDEDGPESIEEMTAPRRVVTGTDADGLSCFAAVEACGAIAGGARKLGFEGDVWGIWSIEKLPDLLPTRGRTAPPEELLPKALGAVIAIARLLPTDQRGAFVQRDAMDTVFVMSGEVSLKVEGGEEVRLTAGDVLVQNGAAHAWHNHSDEPAVIGIAALGAARFSQRP
jgi:uncharacterized cupin superfamily protein